VEGVAALVGNPYGIYSSTTSPIGAPNIRRRHLLVLSNPISQSASSSADFEFLATTNTRFKSLILVGMVLGFYLVTKKRKKELAYMCFLKIKLFFRKFYHNARLPPLRLINNDTQFLFFFFLAFLSFQTKSQKLFSLSFHFLVVATFGGFCQSVLMAMWFSGLEMRVKSKQPMKKRLLTEMVAGNHPFLFFLFFF
jgi:hypothetical protein